MRTYSINLAGRVNNFPLPKHRPLIPLYEAVVNSLHAIEERKVIDPKFRNGTIYVRVIRSPQMSLIDDEGHLPVDGFEVIDNGIGFTEQNMKSFIESDSTYKAKIGGKGVGRFSWLKAFSSVSISSVFSENGEFQKREFEFSLNNDVIDDSLVDEATTEYKTIVKLSSYKNEYQKCVPSQLNTIAMRIMQHCLVYFLNDNCPQVVIIDGNDSIILNDLFKSKVKTADSSESFDISNSIFHLLHVKIEEKAFPENNQLYLCANNRYVDSKKLETHIVDLDGQIFEQNGFWYVGILTSNYLDAHVDMSRLSFDIPDSEVDSIMDISFDAIINESCLHIEKYLADYLLPIAEKKAKDIECYVTTTAPQYRHLLKYMPEDVAKIKPQLSKNNLDDELYKIKRKFDKNTKEEQKKLLKKVDSLSMSSKEYVQYFQQQIKKISDANSAMLAEYVIRRRVIIELLDKGLQRQEDGKFNKEKYIHGLIYPMQATSADTDYDTHNLWLIDEKLSYCNFISSDVSFDNDPKQERADILMLDSPVAVSDGQNDNSVYDTIIIFELKKPTLNNYTVSNNPIDQLYSYVEKIRMHKAKDKFHREIKVSESTKYYLYALCDITPKLLPLIERNGFTKTPDNAGYYAYNKTYNAYFEILSYDKIITDARKRNRVLFEKLGLV
jgi:hypothetical protein